MDLSFLNDLFSRLGSGGAANQTSSLLSGTPYSDMTLGDTAAVAPGPMATMAGNAAQGQGGLLSGVFGGNNTAPMPGQGNPQGMQLGNQMMNLGLGMMRGPTMAGAPQAMQGFGGGGGSRQLGMPNGLQVLANLRQQMSPGGM